MQSLYLILIRGTHTEFFIPVDLWNSLDPRPLIHDIYTHVYTLTQLEHSSLLSASPYSSLYDSYCFISLPT